MNVLKNEILLVEFGMNGANQSLERIPKKLQQDFT